MLVGRRYLLHLTPEQEKYAEGIAGACRSVWNTGLEQRRIYRQRGAWMNYEEQCKQLADAKKHPDCAWLKEAPSHCLQQALRDLDKACRTRGTWKIHWRSKARTQPSFRFPDPRDIHVERLNKRWGRVRLMKIGALRFRWTRPIGGQVRNATVLREGGRWYVAFCVEDGLVETVPNGKSPVGVDRGVKIAVATSDGWMRDRQFATQNETIRLKHLQQHLSRCKPGSNHRRAARARVGALLGRARDRRADFNAWTANRLTAEHGLVVFEDLKVSNMTASAKGTIAEPGTNVRQKSGLNRAILDKGWGDLLRRCEYKARVNGSRIVRVPAAYTSQTCNACGHVAKENRESQAVFRCVACKHQANADVNAAKNILGAGLALTGRGDLGVTRSAKRQPPGSALAAEPARSRGSSAQTPGWKSKTRRLTMRTTEPWDLFAGVAAITAWLDTSNPTGPHEDSMRVLKLVEEAGEAAAAYIGMVGQNPRKGVTHTQMDLLNELADVALTALCAMQHFTQDTTVTRGVLASKVAGIMARSDIRARAETAPLHYTLNGDHAVCGESARLAGGGSFRLAFDPADGQIDCVSCRMYLAGALAGTDGA